LEAAQKSNSQSETPGAARRWTQGHQELNQLLQLTDDQQFPEKVKTLTDALAFETKRRETVEPLAADAFNRAGAPEFWAWSVVSLKAPLEDLLIRTREGREAPCRGDQPNARRNRKTEAPGRQPVAASSPAEPRPQAIGGTTGRYWLRTGAVGGACPQARAPILGLLERLKRVTNRWPRRPNAGKTRSGKRANWRPNSPATSSDNRIAAHPAASAAGWARQPQKTSDELQVIQSALVERVRELAAEPDGAASHAARRDTVPAAKGSESDSWMTRAWERTLLETRHGVFLTPSPI